MRNLLWLFFILGLFVQTACVTQRACNEKFPTKTDSIVVVHDSIITVHDTIKIPFGEITFDTTGVIPESVTFHKLVKKGNLTSRIDISKGKLTVDCKADSLQMIVDRQAHQIETLTKVTKKPKDVIVEVIPWWSKALLFVFGCEVLAVLFIRIFTNLRLKL